MIQHRLRPLWLLSLSIFLVLAVPLSAQPQTDPTLTAEESAMLSGFAPYLPGEPAMLDRHLEALGFRPEAVLDAQLAEEYPNWPDVRKLDLARRAAIAANGEPDGAEFLRNVARMIAATQTDAIRFEPGMASMFPEPPETPIEPPKKARAFATLTAAQQNAPLDPAVRELVFLINKYTSATPGGTPHLMRICCLLADGQIAEILLQSRSSVAALERAIVTSPIPPSLQDKLRRSLRHLLAHHASLQLETLARDAQRALSLPGNSDAQGDGARLADEMVRQALEGVGIAPDVIDRTIAEVPSRGESSPEDLAGNRQAFVDTLAEINQGVADRATQRLATGIGHGLGPDGTAGLAGEPPAGGRVDTGNGGGLSFSDMTGSEGGFGGVVFGNALAEDLPPLASMRWIPSYELANRAFGQVEVTFEHGAKARSAVLPTDMVSPAALLVFSETVGGLDRFDVEVNGAIPLAGVASSPLDPKALAQEDGQISKTNTIGFVINPALEGTRLGEAAVLADAVYAVRSREWFRTRVDAFAPNDAVRADFRTWQNMILGFYKITDAPLEIIWDGAGMLDVRAIWPVGSIGEQDDDLRSRSLLTMRTFGLSSKPRGEFETPFHRLVPVLAEAHPGFSDLNAFAESFALARWAVADGLTEISDLPELARGPLRRHVFVADQSVLIVNPNEVFEANTELLAALVSKRFSDPNIVEGLQIALDVSVALQRLHSLTLASNMDADAIKKAMTNLWTERLIAAQNSLALAAELPSTTEENLRIQFWAAHGDYLNSPDGSVAREEADNRRSVINAIMALSYASVDGAAGALHHALWAVLKDA